ncbi:related to the member of the syntaxin family of t-SNAREs TLG2 [Rhynchosporium agropyri]|uniref:Related to the member of the syntaxin family of t-SNAREs TLG2 n=1 Tax=Rhynchosporium agropyri TaxID=914238 RepID=A0A1E1KGD7_9HELO|nr:related to the member of the syntaxin family of t-SNAREs TLG2 [Rhynchosporium agropyri]
MWRDRTNLYISYRQSYAHHPAKKTKYSSSSNGFSSSIPSGSSERQGLMSAGAFEDDGDAVIEMDLLPPRWADISDEVTEYLTDIASKSLKLEKLHQKHVLPGFNDEDVKRNEEGEIERLTQDITRGFHNCQKAIQRVEMMVRENKQQGGISKGEETMARNIQISLAGRVQEASAGFRKKQSAYLKKLRGLSGMNPSIERTSTPPYNNFTDPSLLETETDKSYSQSTLTQTQTQKHLISNDAAITQREREITDIAQGIIELADIFKELQTMIIDQGTMLDRIDYNVERMAVDVKAADKELNVASGYQKKGTKRRIIFLLILLVVGMFILLMVKPKRHSDGAVEKPPEQVGPGESATS